MSEILDIVLDIEEAGKKAQELENLASQLEKISDTELDEILTSIQNGLLPRICRQPMHRQLRLQVRLDLEPVTKGIKKRENRCLILRIRLSGLRLAVRHIRPHIIHPEQSY